MGSRLKGAILDLQRADETTERIVRFLKTHVQRIGARFLVVGMSGGLDSSITAVLCSMAVGGQRTIGLSLTEAATRKPSNLEDAQEVATKHSIIFKSLDITYLIKASASLVGSSNRLGRVPVGNIKARLRAMILYYYANEKKGLVVGTGDKSEIMLGYFTKYGDGACDIQPLADMYKTTLRCLGQHLGLPERICAKPSSPDLWPGQTAEKELGLSYEKIDLILWGLERWIPPADISRDLGLSLATVERIRRRWLLAEHKRRPPLAMKLGFRTSGQDLRMPYNLAD
jgi:NAD+ synthase